MDERVKEIFEMIAKWVHRQPPGGCVGVSALTFEAAVQALQFEIQGPHHLLNQLILHLRNDGPYYFPVWFTDSGIPFVRVTDGKGSLVDVLLTTES